MSVTCKVHKHNELLDAIHEFSLCAQGFEVVSVLAYLCSASSLKREMCALDRDEGFVLLPSPNKVHGDSEVAAIFPKPTLPAHLCKE